MKNKNYNQGFVDGYKKAVNDLKLTKKSKLLKRFVNLRNIKKVMNDENKSS